MFIPKSIVDWITTVKLDEGNKLREELAAIRSERDAIKAELIASKINGDWLRMQVNSLQIERSVLMEKAYNLKMPTPEIVRKAAIADDGFDPKDFSFDDVGDDMAKKLGFPVYATATGNA